MSGPRDAEDTVRQLFAVATEDVPPGLDLLAGFEDRRRASLPIPHRHRPRIRVLAAAVAAVAAAITAITVALTAGPAPSALAQVTRAVAATTAQSYRISSRVATVGQSPSGFPAPAAVTVTGVFDPARGLGQETAGGGFDVRYAGGYLYVPLPARYWQQYENAHHTAPIPGQAWLRLTAPLQPARGSPGLAFTLQGGTVPSLQQLNPQSLLALLKSASQVRVSGDISGPGWTGTRYSFSASAILSAGTGNPLSLTVRGTVDVDQQGRVRRLAATETTRDTGLPRGYSAATVNSINVTFSDFGLPVSVTVPPSSQILVP